MPVIGFLNPTIAVVILVIGLLSGILAIVREVQLMYLPAQADAQKTFWGWVRIAFILAAGLAWANEHSKVSELSKRSSIMSLVGQAIGLSVAPAEDREQSAIVSVIGIISNPTGPPTVATQFELSAIFGNGEVVKAIPITLGHGDIVLAADNTTTTMILKGSDFWPDAGLSSPIPTGGARKGWMIGLFKNISQQKFLEGGTKVIVTFNDIQGKKYSMGESVTGPRATFIDPRSLQPFNK